MNFYVAASVTNKEKVTQLVTQIRQANHIVEVDWTLDDEIPVPQRDAKSDVVRQTAIRDLKGIRDADVLILLTEPSEARSMYVELGAAIALYEVSGRPLIYALGTVRNQTIFYYHPAIRHVASLEEILNRAAELQQLGNKKLVQDEGLEEYRALRAEMLQIIGERLWGPATYIIAVGGVLCSRLDLVMCYEIIIALSIPYLLHTLTKEEARLRMGTYIRLVLEPRLSGIRWENYLTYWRSNHLGSSNGATFSVLATLMHTATLGGLYFTVSAISFILIVSSRPTHIYLTTGCILIVALLIILVGFIKVFSKSRRLKEETKAKNFSQSTAS